MMLSPEVIAQDVIHAAVAGDKSKLDKFLDSVETGALHVILDNLRKAGNNAFRHGQHSKALDLYYQAMSGTRDVRAMAILNCNIAAVHLATKAYDAALEAAGLATQQDGTNAKAWFRAAKAFEGRGELAHCLTMAKMALQKASCDTAPLSNYVTHVEKALAKEKALKRVSVDYSRFDRLVLDAIDVDEDAEQRQAAARNGASQIVEWSKHISPEQKRQVEQIFLGRQPDAPRSTRVKYKHKFNPLYVDSGDDGALPGLELRRRIGHGLRCFLELQSGVNKPGLIAKRQLGTARLRAQLAAFLGAEIEAIHNALDACREDATTMYNPDEIRVAILGAGSGLTSLVAVKTLKEKAATAKVITVSESSISCNDSIVAEVWDNNLGSQDPEILLRKFWREVTTNSNAKEKVPATLRAAISDIPDTLSLLVLDPELIFPFGLAPSTLRTLRESRSVCSRYFPALLRYRICAAMVSSSIEKSRDVRWAPFLEALGPSDTVKEYSDFRNVAHVSLCGGSAEANRQFGVVARVDDIVRLIISEESVINTLLVVVEYSTGGEGSERERWSTFGSPAFQYLDSIKCKKDTVLHVRVSYTNGAGLQVRLVQGDNQTNPRQYQRRALPRWMFNQSSHVHEAVRDVSSAAFRRILDEKTSWLDALDAQTKRPSDSSASRVEALVINAGDMYFGSALLRSLAQLQARRRKQPTPQSQILSLEFCEAAAAAHREALHEDATALVERASKPEALHWRQCRPSEGPANIFEADVATVDGEREATALVDARFSAKAVPIAALLPTQDSAESRIAHCQLTNRSPAAPLEDIPPRERLSAPCDLLIYNTVDCGLFGDGMLASIRYVHRALTGAQHTCVTIPTAARVCGILCSSVASVDLGGNIGILNYAPWNRVLLGPEKFFKAKESSFYGPSRFENVVQLSEPFVIAEFPSLGATPRACQRSVSIEIWNEGEADSILFWYEIRLSRGDNSLGLTNAPKRLLRLLDGPDISKSRAALYQRPEHHGHPLFQNLPLLIADDTQALQFLEERVLVLQKEHIRLLVDYTDTSIHISWDKSNTAKFSVRRLGGHTQLVKDPTAVGYWHAAEEKIKEITEGLAFAMAKMQTARDVCDAAISVAAHPYIDDHRFDPEDATWFALSFFTI